MSNYTYGKKIIRRNMCPNPKQYLFLLDHHRHVAFGGARGGGKSWVVDIKAVALARRFGAPDEWSQGIKICIVRRTLEDLKKNHLTQLKLLVGNAAKYNTQDKCFYFKNGATIQLAYCDNDKDSDHFQGVEYDVIFIEEATQLQEDWLKKIVTSCRGINDFPHRIYYTCNPGGPGHAYIKRLFVDKIYEGDENPEDYSFIQSLVTDNLILQKYSPEYVSFLNNLPPKLRSAWRDGSWDIYQGMYFEEFRNDPEHYKDRRWTHVIDPIPIKKYWPIYRSFDWGYNKPFSCGWYTVDDDGVIYRIAELYGVQKAGNESIADMGVKWVPEKVFSEIQRMEQEHPLLAGRQISGVADPAIWDAEMGKSIAMTAEKYGIFFEPGDHKRIPGWMQCHYRLMFDEEGYAKFYVFNTCREFIRTIPTLQYDEHKTEDLDTHGEDHIADEWRYLLMKFIITPEPEKAMVLPMFGADPLKQFKGAMAW
jgi:hypothetical protein